MAQCLDDVARQAAKESLTDVDFLDRLLEAEGSARHERDAASPSWQDQAGALPVHQGAGYPTPEFAFPPSIGECQIRELATLRFAHGENVLLLGPPGVDKTHLTIVLGVTAITLAIVVRLASIVDLIEMIHKHANKDRLGYWLNTLCLQKTGGGAGGPHHPGLRHLAIAADACVVRTLADLR